MAPESPEVIMAVLAAEFKNINDKLDGLIESQDVIDRVVVEHSVRLETVAGQIATQCQRLDGRIDKQAEVANNAVTGLSGRIDKVDDKLKGWQIGQSSLTLIAAGVATWLGSR